MQPVLLVIAEHEFHQFRQVVQVLTGVIQIDDLRSLGELLAARFQIHADAVTQDDHLADVGGATAAGLAGHERPELECRAEGGHIGGRGQIAHRVAFGVDAVWVNATAIFTSRVCAVPSPSLPSRPAVSAANTGTPVPSMHTYSMSGTGAGGSTMTWRAAIAAACAR